MTSEEFPAAEIVSQRGQIAGRLAVSRMWLATLACLAGAIALVWFSLEPAGTEIAIRFQEGHGLKPGDTLRNRGIDVGRVLSVELDKDLAGVDVRAELAPAAKALAREGTRFWIVRPTVDVTGISGLETAVGSKYIA
ncbi:MAG: MlaD family protein, partial [Planctomycetota bacterium]